MVYTPEAKQKVVPAGATSTAALSAAPGDTFVPTQVGGGVVVVGGGVVVVGGGVVVVGGGVVVVGGGVVVVGGGVVVVGSVVVVVGPPESVVTVTVLLMYGAPCDLFP
jgi:hypothetical protein